MYPEFLVKTYTTNEMLITEILSVVVNFYQCSKSEQLSLKKDG